MDKWLGREEDEIDIGVCQKCEGTGIVKDGSGVHVCFDCLLAGRLDVHSKDV